MKTEYFNQNSVLKLKGTPSVVEFHYEAYSIFSNQPNYIAKKLHSVMKQTDKYL